MRTVSLINLGCKVNQYETDRIAGALSSTGLNVVFGIKPADIYVLNTCAVTNEGERKSRNMLTKLIKLNPNASIYVCGCASQNNSDNFTTNPNVKFVIGTQNKMEIAKQICKDYGLEFNQSLVQTTSRTRGVLKCQEGCNNFCTYCLIPYLRGREKSRPLCELNAELDLMENEGINEVVLAGINLSSYGSDFKDGTNFLSLAKIFKNRKMRFRFSSLEVNVVTKELLEYLSSMPNFCDHFHLSMQSGSDHTLKMMNRHYTSGEYLQKVELIRKYFPFAGITTDVIVGFPTETEEHFKQTLETCKNANFADMHVFVYSSRSGTVAAKYKNIATNVKERAKILADLSSASKQKFLESNFGKSYQVIIEKQADANGYCTGHTPNYILCYVKGNYKSNDILNVQIKNIYNDGVIAKLINK